MGKSHHTVSRWTITVAYIIVSILCFWAAAETKMSIQINSNNHIIWFGISVLLVLLAINKHLNLHKWFTIVGRGIARSQGWYGRRRKIQKVFIMIVALCSYLFLCVLIWWFKENIIHYWLTLAGMIFLVSFTIIRAVSHHRVDYLLNKPKRLRPFNMRFFLELGGILIVALGAIQSILFASHIY